MNIFKRIKNLWTLSEWSPMKLSENKAGSLPHGTIVAPIVKRVLAKQATIIDMQPDVNLDEEITNETN